MRIVLKWGVVVGLALLGAALLAFGLAVQGQPQVPERADVSPADVDRAVALLRAHDPRRASAGQLRWLVLGARDLDLLADHAARRFAGARAQAQLLPGRTRLQASLPAPWGRWFNVELTLHETRALPEPDALRVGHLPLPAWALAPVLRALAARAGLKAEAALALQAVEGVSFAPQRLLVRYRITPDTAERLRSALVSPDAQQRLRVYAAALLPLLQPAEAEPVSLATLLPPLFKLAAERSAAGSDAAAENRAALLTLTLFATRRSLGLVYPPPQAWPPTRPIALQERFDFPLHFLVSAVIAAESGTPLADAVGLWKEQSDARRGGSGFSFNDIAADRAGTRFGERAAQDAARLQARVSAGVAESDLMPEARDLPELLPQAELERQYGGVGGEGYRRLMAEIEARIAALPPLK